jgi:hypothetical protein
VSNQIIVPKKNKIDETEQVVLPYVKCGVCGKPTQTGLHQIRLILIKSGRLQRNRVTGAFRKIPPVMKRQDVYMCTDCVKKGKKWPGTNPIYPK